MSESHFMSLFKRVTGLSFVTYCNHFRIERAQALLTKSRQTMAEISQQVGFCDQSYFGTVFRRIVGMTPASYRSRMLASNQAEQGSRTTCPP
jgi:two-component system response regulator YesN